jgi:broad specificity phosphatase PhoE
MRNLVLVRHAQPQRIHGVPASEWPLSAEGRTDAVSVVPLLSPYSFSQVLSSPEPKAYETARGIAAALRLEVVAHGHFAEHKRSETEFLTQETFEQSVVDLFARPNERVFGQETGMESIRRFEQGLGALAQSSSDTVVVTHGRIMSLYIEHVAGQSALDFWEHLTMPCAVEIAAGKARFL